MGVQLGNYIHWKYSNYKQLGPATPGQNGQKPPSISKLVNDLKKDIMSNIKKRTLSKNDIKEAQNMLNFFYGKSQGRNAGFTAEQRAKLLDIVKKHMEKEGKNLENLKIDDSNLSALQIQTSTEIKDAGRARRDLQGTQFTYVDAIYRRLEILQKRVDAGLVGGDLRNEVNTFLKSAQGIYEQTRDLVEKKLSKLPQDANTPNTLNIRFKESDWLQKNRTFIDELNKYMQLTSVATDIEITGLLCEYISAIMPEIYTSALQGNIDALIKDDFIDQLIKDNHKGQERSAKVLIKDWIYGGRSTHQHNNSSFVPINIIGKLGQKINITQTQNKVDINFKLSDNRVLPASVKNYAEGASAIHILKGTSLLKYLQLYPSFGNHYLNITANKKRSNTNRAPAIDVAEAHRGMLMALGAHALAGGLYGADNARNVQKYKGAEILIVNKRSNKGGQFFVYDISTLIDKIETALIFNKGGLDLNKPIEWENQYIYTQAARQRKGPNNYRTAYGRCINILQQLHAVKLDISIDARYLSSHNIT